MAEKSSSKKPKKNSFATEQAKGAATDLLQEMFQDFHRNRKEIYLLNFFRGIFFGLGSALGGGLIVASAVWLFTFFSEAWFEPLIKAIQSAAS